MAAVIIVGCATAKVCNYLDFYTKHLGHLAFASAAAAAAFFPRLKPHK